MKHSEKPTNALNAIEKRALLEEFERRERQKASHSAKYAATSAELSTAARMRDEMFGPQRALFDDPATRKVGFCTRRAGKTIGTALHLLASLMENPSDLFLYMAQTRELAKVYMWKEMREWAAKFELPLDFNESYMWIKHQRGGGTIILRGADNEREVNKLRGPKWRCVVLDESSTYGAWMEQLVIEVIGPALRDQNGTLILIGTAGRKREGLFYEACHGLKKRKDGRPIYTLHQWSLTENPNLSEQAKDLDLIREEEGMAENDPRFLREYKMIWASGDSERVWSGYDPERNDVDLPEGLMSLPREHKWETLLGMDFGWQDESGIAVLAWSRTIKRIYLLETWAKNHAFSDEIAMKVEEFRGKYGVKRCVGDVGGQGKIFQQQLQRDYKIYVEPAKKMEKLTYIEFMNSALLRGDLLVQRGDKVTGEMLDVAWDDERKNIGKHEKDNRAHAALYGWRAANYVAGKSQLEPKRGSMSGNEFARKEKLAVFDKKPKNNKAFWDIDGTDTNRPSDADSSFAAEWRRLFQSRPSRTVVSGRGSR